MAVSLHLTWSCNLCQSCEFVSGILGTCSGGSSVVFTKGREYACDCESQAGTLIIRAYSFHL